MIVTHERPQLSDIVAILVLRRFGEELFPGVGQAPVIFNGCGGANFLGKTQEELDKEGVLLIGIGGGRFDEHPRNGKSRKSGECEATLVAKYLGVFGSLAHILKDVCEQDLGGQTPVLHLASAVKRLHDYHSANPKEVFDIVENIMEAYFEDVDKLARAVREFEAKARKRLIGSFKVAFINSESDHMDRASRKCGADVLVQFRESGHVQIFTKKIFSVGQPKLVDLRDLARLLRMEEQRLGGVSPGSDGYYWKQMESQEGSVKGAELWWFMPRGGFILNGSKSHPSVPPTKISHQRIEELAEIALSGDFHPAFERSVCSRGRCERRCPWFNLGLVRCRALRFARASERRERAKRV